MAPQSAIEGDWRPQPSLFAQEQAQARQSEREAEHERQELEAKTANRRKADSAHEKAAIMAFIGGLPEEERETLEQEFREYLAGAVPATVAKRFEGGVSWCSDPIIRTEALAYLGAIRPDFPTAMASTISNCREALQRMNGG